MCDVGVCAADAKQRIGFESIKMHPWFVEDLPPGVFEANDKLLSITSQGAKVHRTHAFAALTACSSALVPLHDLGTAV